MAGRVQTVSLLAQIAVRNLFASRLKTLIVGGIIFFGAALVVVGTSLLDSIDAGMRQSLIGSSAGHVQVFDSRSKDDLAIWGGMMGDSELEPLEDFAAVKRTLLTVPGVKGVVPMGIHDAMLSSGTPIDLALEKLRGQAKELGAAGATPELRARYESQKAHVRRMVELLKKQIESAKALVDETKFDVAEWQHLERAASDGFWRSFDEDPFAALEFLENKVAPQGMDADLLWIRYVGTDPQAFQRSFDRMEMVDGTPIPAGQRGILLGKLYYEEVCKLRTARRLDRIKEARDLNGKSIAKDETLKRFVKENVSQVNDIVIRLDPEAALTASLKLRKSLGSKEEDLAKLLAALLDTDDRNFDERYRAFYADVAPLLPLYAVRVGDTLTIKAFTKAGYMKSVNVKVWGIFQFRGLEKSIYAGMFSVMDLMTFRDLYGYMTATRAAEIKKIKEASGARAVARESAEAELFGSPGEVVEQASAGAFDELTALAGSARQARAEAQRPFTTAELESGVALNVAVLLDDPGRIPEAIAAIEAAGRRDGLTLKAIDWQKASGMIGQFVTLSRLILYVAVLIIFLVATVIINNALVMAALQRVKEIGTMRAIGAQRRFVLGMVLVESLAVGLLFGALGAGFGGAIIAWLGRRGIPATSDELFFFFSGPRLLPTLGVSHLVIAFVIVVVVSVVSCLYPARLAMRVTPLEAMQSEE